MGIRHLGDPLYNSWFGGITLGIHELRGYGRQLSGVGLAPEVARFAGLETFCASDEIGLGWDRIADEGFARGY